MPVEKTEAGPRRRWAGRCRLGIVAMLAAALAGCVVAPAYYPHRACCYYHPYRW
jgi:hypothetical protein